ncbi:MAG TPA: VIT domain-containing protein [Planctomycetota bacterium]|nr:VIT domain-containing protein [Planctomycetota bacterium]
MTCDQAELHMAELLAGEIAPAERRTLEQHLLECATCRDDFELARVGARVEWADVPVPHELIETTRASLREPPPLVRFFRWGTAAAALLGVAVLLVTSSRSIPPTPPTVAAAACASPRTDVLATMQDAVVGGLACKDEDGRPVGDLGLRSHEVSVEILDGVAKTTVEENFENHTDRRLEGTFTFPLPADASISRLALEVNGKIEEGTCLERERAKQVFESIVRRMQDPALLEWQPGGLFKCRVFPIEARATKRVIVAYTQTLPCFQGKMTYVYPLASEKTRTHPPGEVTINVLARFSGALAKIESTSHHLDVQRKDAHEASMTFRATNYRPNNDFVVALEPTEEEVRVVCHKPEGEDGYFACFATPKGGEARVPAKYTCVLDASASISAPRLEVAKRLVRAMMERRIPGDRFEVLTHSVEVTSSGEVDLRAANTFMDSIRPIGGSDVLKALEAAGPGEIVYIGKGAPTFGETETAKILEAAKGKRIRTIAVGSDANLGLLERLGGLMRITPNDDVDKRVAEIAATLGSQAVSELKVEGPNVSDVGGTRDVFYGERLVAVGRYKAAGPSKLLLSGRGYRREVDVDFPAKEEGHNPVRRLWAQRRLSDLMAQGPSKQAEITELGVKYQIMTPYTSFLVLESEQMWKDQQLKRELQKQDQLLARCTTADADLRTEVTRKVAHLLELAYRATEQRKYDRTTTLCDEILLIDPEYPVAKDLREHVEKLRHKEEYGNFTARKLDALKKLTDGDATPKIPEAEKLRIPSREQWGEVSKRLTEAVIKTESGTTVGENEGRLAVDRKLDTMKVDMAFENTKLEDVVAYLRDASGLNIVLDADVRDKVDPDKVVTYKASNLTLKDNLRSVIGPLGLDYMVTPDNVVLLTDPWKKALAEVATRDAGRRKDPLTGAEFISPTVTVKPVDPNNPAQARPGFSSQETARLDSWDVREQTFTRNVTASGAPITEALPMTVESFDYAQGIPLLGDIPMKGWLFKDGTTVDKPFGRFVGAGGTAYGLSRVEEEKAREEYRRYVMADFPGVDVEFATGSTGKMGRLQQRAGKGPLPASPDPDTVTNSTVLRFQGPQQRSADGASQTAGVEADMQIYVRQLEVQLAQIQELTTTVDEHRAKLAKSLNEKSMAVAELQYARQRAERLERDLSELEGKHVEMARDKAHLEEKVNAIVQNGANVNVAPKKALEGRVTAVALEIGLIVISIGKDDGVVEGDEFTIYRGGDIIARIVIDRADRKWAAGKIALKKGDPRVGDEVSNHIFISGPRPAFACETAVPVDESKAGLERIRTKMGLRE